MSGKTTSISVSLEVYKLIEQNRLSFEESHDEILKRMLNMSFEESHDEVLRRMPNLPIPKEQRITHGDFYLGCAVSVPFGTQLRKFYKSIEYKAEIKDGGIWLNGKKYPTLNQAANAVSNSNQNAWKFWEVKRPQDSKWILVDNLRNLSQVDLEDFD